MSKGGGAEPTVATYYAGIHFVLGYGPWDKIIAIFVDDKLAWSGNATDGDIAIYSPELFGGETREGGITGTATIKLGSSNQTDDAYLVSKIGDVPSFRGVMSVILKDVYFGLNYYFKPWAFVGTRIHKLRNGGAQWQDSYAETIASTDSMTGVVESLEFYLNYGILIMSSPHGLKAGDLVTITGASPSYYNGTFTVSDLSLSARGLLFLMGTSPTVVASGDIKVSEKTTKVSLINAVHIVRECLTDSNWGLGVASSLIDETSFLASAITCHNEGLGFSFLWDNDSSILDFVGEVLKHIQANLYLDRSDGKYHLELIRPVANLNTLLTLNTTNVKEVNNFKRKSIGELASSVIVKYTDGSNWKENTVVVSNPSLAARQGIPISKTVTYAGVITNKVAYKLAIRDLQQYGLPVYSCTIICNRAAEDLHIGSAFRLDWPDYTSEVLTMRVVSLNLGTPFKQEITIEAIQDNFQAASIIYETPLVSGWNNPVSTPKAVDLRLINEVPYYLVAKLKGDAYAKAVDVTTSFMAIAGASPSDDSISADIYTSPNNSSYVLKAMLDFCFSGLVTSDMDKTTTTIVVNSPIDIVLLKVGSFIQIDNELLNVSAISLNTLTVVRGVHDTVPEIHLTNARIFGWQDFYSGDGIIYTFPSTVYVKLTTRTPKGVLALSAAPYDSIPLTGRMHRPYPPANVQLNSTYWPTTITLSNLTVSWATRNRILQTTNTVYGFYSASITTEPGVTYYADLRRVDTNALLTSFSGNVTASAIMPTLVALPGTITSITFATTTATVTTSVAHNLVTGRTVRIAGASDTLYNGDKVITLVDSTHFTYTLASTPVANASGTLTINASIYAGSVKLVVWSMRSGFQCHQTVTHTFTMV